MELTIEEALQQGIAAHRNGKPHDAERFYRAILQAQPNHPDANHNLGVLAVSVGKPLEAIAFFKLALDTNSQVKQFWLSYVDTLLKTTQFAEARHAIADAERSDVSDETLHLLRKKLHDASVAANEKSGAGLKVSEKRGELAWKKRDPLGRSLSTGSDLNQINQLIQHYSAGRYTEAEELALSLTRRQPTKPFGWKMLGAVMKQTGRLNESLLPMKKFMELSPEDPEAHYNLGVTLQKLGKYDDAVASYRQAVVVKPDFAEAHNNLGITLQALDRFNEAEASYRHAIAQRPDFADSHFNLGIVLQSFGQLEEAEAVYRQSLALKPDYTEAHYNLGAILRQLGRFEEAEASYGQAVVLKPDFAEAHNSLGVTLQALGRCNEAAASYRHAIVLKPDFAEAHNNLGVNLAGPGSLDEAEASFRRALAFQPAYAEAHNNLGNTLKEANRLDDADASYRKAIALKPNYAEAHYNLGITLQELGRLDEAVSSYQEAIALQHNPADAHRNMGYVLRKLKRYQEAISHFDLAGDPLSMSRSLECLYIDKKYNELHGRLRCLSTLADSNIGVAAVSAFVSHQLKTQDPYQFCKKPLDCIMLSNLRDFVFDSSSLINEILIESRGYQLSWESRTTKFGFQGAGDIFENPSSTLSELELVIGEALTEYLAKYKSASDRFISAWPRNYKLTGWFNRLIKNGYQTSHIHVNGWISGVIYLKTTPSSNSGAGAIEFSLHGHDLPIIDENIPRHTHRPKEGDIVLFPSSLFHKTIPFEIDSERCVIAFDMQPCEVPIT